MHNLVSQIELFFATIPMPFLEVWGRFGYIIGFLLMLLAYGGFTFRISENQWGFGRERQAWDSNALRSILLTSIIIPLTGYIGSFIILVPGAQTFESLKDLSVFICVVLFGYPALLTVPFAYGISDAIEGVPSQYLFDWIFGYFINPACFWLAYQFIGQDPDFRKIKTWGRYAAFVLIFLSIEPILWGYICSDKFTSEISYRNITPALFFTTSITWIIAPFAMLIFYPLARKFKMFWADIPGYVQRKFIRENIWAWVSGSEHKTQNVNVQNSTVPIRILLLIPSIMLVMMTFFFVTYLTLSHAEESADKLTRRLHQEIAENINLKLDNLLAQPDILNNPEKEDVINSLLKETQIANYGRVFIINSTGKIVASSQKTSDDLPTRAAIDRLQQMYGDFSNINSAVEFKFEFVTEKPLSRQSWLAKATPYQDNSKKINWIEITAIPASYYLSAVQTGESKSAMALAISLFIALIVAAILSELVILPIRRMLNSTESLAKGDLTQRVPTGKISELNSLSSSYNDMAEKLQQSVRSLENEIQQQKNIRESLNLNTERLRMATRHSNIGIWEWNVKTNELIWDDAMYKLYGIKKENFSGAFEAWASALIPADLESANIDIQAALEGTKEFSREFRIVWPDSSVHFIKAEALFLRDSEGKATRAIGINYDLTESRLKEEELQKHRHHLEDLIAERTRELVQARDQAEAANSAKSTFISNISHELRTPLNSVIGYSQLMAKAKDLTVEQKKNLEIINRSGNHLLKLINNVLELSKIDAGQVELKLESVNLNSLLRDVVEMFEKTIEQAGLKLKYEFDDFPSVKVDPIKLKQILINLISNAIKFTEQGEIKLSAKLSKPQAEEKVEIIFSVKDSGVGIKPEDQAKILEPFVQLHTHATKSGTGLGLSISKQFLKLMQSELAIESEPEVGSVFSFVLNLNKTESIASPSPNAANIVKISDDQPKVRILVVDDVEDIRRYVRLELESVGFVVDEAEDGVEAIEIFESFKPHLILMDSNMPVMNGITATREIRKMPGGTEVKIVVLSAAVFIEERSKITAGLTDDFLSKPVDGSELFGCIEKHLNIKFDKNLHLN